MKPPAAISDRIGGILRPRAMLLLAALASMGQTGQSCCIGRGPCSPGDPTCATGGGGGGPVGAHISPVAFNAEMAWRCDQGIINLPNPDLYGMTCGAAPVHVQSTQHTGFLAELNGGDPSNAKVAYEWAPVDRSAGPCGSSEVPVTDKPTVHPRQAFVWGTLAEWSPSGSDLRFAHPFAQDSARSQFTDFDAAISNPAPLSPYAGLDGGNLPFEIDQGLVPHLPNGSLWYSPSVGDGVALRGTWIFDCGHPDAAHTEIHPPSFVAFSHTDTTVAPGDGAVVTTTYKTVAHAFAVPFHQTQLYTPHPDDVVAFSNPARYDDQWVTPFPKHLLNEATKLGAPTWGPFLGYPTSSTLEAHQLIEANRFDDFSFEVCHPDVQPPPNNPILLPVKYHFTVRPGVTLSVASDAVRGCATIAVHIGSGYAPWVPQRFDWNWSWDDIQAAAERQLGETIDPSIEQQVINTIRQVRQDKLGIIGDIGNVKNDVDKGVMLDAFAPLTTLAAESTEPITVSDQQPFPLYGWVEVQWIATCAPQCDECGRNLNQCGTCALPPPRCAPDACSGKDSCGIPCPTTCPTGKTCSGGYCASTAGDGGTCGPASCTNVPCGVSIAGCACPDTCPAQGKVCVASTIGGGACCDPRVECASQPCDATVCGSVPCASLCATGARCYHGQCCTPSCEGRSCGSDQCGGQCGVCPAGGFTCVNGTCVANDNCTCKPDSPCGACNGKCTLNCP